VIDIDNLTICRFL